MIPLLFALAILGFTFQNISFKQFNMNFMKNPASYFMFAAAFYSLVGIIFASIGIDVSLFETGVVLLGLLFAVSFMAAIYLFMKSLENGPLGLTFLFFSAGIIIPILYGIIVQGEPAPFHNFVGLGLMFAAFFISTAGKSEGKMSKKWVLFIIPGSFFNGVIGLTIKLIPEVMPEEAIREFLFIGFSQGAVISLIIGFVLIGRFKKSISNFKSVSFAVIVFIAAIATTVGNYTMAQLSLMVSAIVQFPVVSGSLVITSIIASRLVYKEQVTKHHLAAIALGLVAIILLSI